MLGCAKKYRIRIVRKNYDRTLKYFVVKGLTLKGCKQRMEEPMVLKFTTMTLHSLKVLILNILSNNTCIGHVMTVVMEMCTKNSRLAGS